MAPVKRKAPDNLKGNKTNKRISGNGKFKSTGAFYDPKYPIGYFTEHLFNHDKFNSYLMASDGNAADWYRTYKDNGFLHWYVGKDEVVTVMSRGKPLEQRHGGIAHDSMLKGEQSYTFPGIEEDAWCTLYSLYNYLRGDTQVSLYGLRLRKLDNIPLKDANYVLNLADGVTPDRGATFNKRLAKRILVVRKSNQLRILDFLELLGRNQRFLQLLFGYTPWREFYDTAEKQKDVMNDWYLAIRKIRRTIDIE